MAFLPRPVTMMMLVRPAATASSITYWMIGLSTSGSISLGCAFVAGRKRVPRPAAGKTALRILFIAGMLPQGSRGPPDACAILRGHAGSEARRGEPRARGALPPRPRRGRGGVGPLRLGRRAAERPPEGGAAPPPPARVRRGHRTAGTGEPGCLGAQERDEGRLRGDQGPRGAPRGRGGALAAGPAPH